MHWVFHILNFHLGDVMAKKVENSVSGNVVEKKRTRVVVKWQDTFDEFTCEMFSLLSRNSDKDIKLLQRKFQIVLKSVCEMVKTGKRSDIQNDIDNISLALSCLSIKDNEIVGILERLSNLFK